MSSRAWSRLRPENSSIVPCTPRARIGWRGASTRSLKGECTTPIGCRLRDSVTISERRQHLRRVPFGFHVAEYTHDLSLANHEGGAVDALCAVLLRPPDTE